jgi:hypothetical protein
MSEPTTPLPAPQIQIAPVQPPHPVKRYCVTRNVETIERGYISAENETHARVLAERHWGDREKLPGPFVPVSDNTNWQVKEVAA